MAEQPKEFDKSVEAYANGKKLLLAPVNYTLFDKKNEKEALKAIEFLLHQSHVAYDTETTGLNPAELAERLRLAQFAYKGKAYIFDIWRVSKKVKAKLNELLSSMQVMKIIHNASFDIKFSRADLDVYNFGKVFCTMLAQQVLNRGDMSKEVNLQDVLHSYFDVFISKSERLSDWSVPILSEEQLQYAARDVIALEYLAELQTIKLRELDLMPIAKIEFECAEPVGVMELNGIYLNQDKWIERDTKTREEHIAASVELSNMLAPETQMLFGGMRSFNVDSKPKVKQRLIQMGIELPTLKNAQGIEVPTTRAFKLNAMPNKPPVILKLLEYNKLQTHITRYGLNWIDHVSPTTQRIHSWYKQIGAKTGRFSDSEPPKQQIPSKNEFRNAFEAQGDNILTWGDYSQIELRILAELIYLFTGDTQMIDDFKSGKDFHILTASRIFELEIDQVDEQEHRKPSKNMNFLMVYGGGASNLAEKVNIPLSRAEWIVERFFAVNPALRLTLDKLAMAAVTERQSVTLAGRVLSHRFNPHDRKMRGSVERLGKNMPIQGLSADILKIALRLLHNRISYTDIMLTHIVHDEILLESSQEEQPLAERNLKAAMIAAGEQILKHVPVKVDIKSGKYWQK